MTLENRANVLMQFHFGLSRLDPQSYKTMERLLERMIRQAKEDEREACAQTCEALGQEIAAEAIRDMPVF